MRVVFKIGVIGWGFGRETRIARFRDARGTPSDGELRGKQRRNALATAFSSRTIMVRKIAETRERRA
jgi:hypothetical protein